MHFFRALGRGLLFNMHKETYPDLVLEFLSSLIIIQNNAGESTFYFKIGGVEQELTISNLVYLFGLTDSGECMDYCQHPPPPKFGR